MDPVVHFEMAYSDRLRMADFYSKTFGWKAQMLGAEMNNYVVVHTSETDANNMVQKPGMINGGFFERSKDPKAQSALVVIEVKDLEEAMKKITANGGKILAGPMEIPGVGSYAGFEDTEGNCVSVLKPLPTKA